MKALYIHNEDESNIVATCENAKVCIRYQFGVWVPIVVNGMINVWEVMEREEGPWDYIETGLRTYLQKREQRLVFNRYNWNEVSQEELFRNMKVIIHD